MPNISTAGIFKDAVKFSLKNPSRSLFFFKTYMAQKKAAEKRDSHKKSGIIVPPVIIFSITKKCNLSCKGCYDRILRDSNIEELSKKEIREILLESRD